MKIYQMKITLVGFEPAIWRRIEIRSDSTFADLHDAIQSVMEWEGSHLHTFRVKKPGKSKKMFDIKPEFPDSILEPVGDGYDDEEEQIGEWMLNPGDEAIYIYDLGDDWEHLIELEEVKEPQPLMAYPRCVKAVRVAPEEDSRMVVMQQIEEEGQWTPDREVPSEPLTRRLNDDLQQSLPLWRSKGEDDDPFKF
ncbi:pRiA4b ORF-3-like protein [Halobacillus dabanensis]|uniref:PRiA4b ORF-3-like protein n=1 Tax=Halobacillus dabanensis TaxID=240302 RepID=A0A1I3TYR6_HALDA|nr:plasmid pRiA4b ORF-3 family protein [Halobacillus dabanensis]SFJ74796.1 pRiA4b ORF-3-like protein [Halobacillus dabanensis]